jgi:predicted MFS family arabinose efflux permease
LPPPTRCSRCAWSALRLRWRRHRSLNTSVLYIGQAVGSAIGGVLFARDPLHGAGYVAAGFIALALMVVILTRPRQAAAWST